MRWCFHSTSKFWRKKLIPSRSRKDTLIIFLTQTFVTFANRFHTRSLYLSYEPNFRTKLNKFDYLNELSTKFNAMNVDNSLDKNRLISMVLNLNMILREDIKGDIVELGVYRGNTLAPIAYIAQLFQRKVWALDTFNGFSQKQLTGIDGELSIQFQDTSLQHVQTFVGPSTTNVEYIEGNFPNDDTHKRLSKKSFAFVHLDCDLYEPTLSALRFFWPRLNAGGQIFLHDYISRTFQGIERAINDYELEIGKSIPKLLLPDLSTTCVLIKPH